MILYCDEKGEQNVSNWLAFGQRVNEAPFLKKLVSVLHIWV